jgi:hypothetical protein
VQVVQVELLLEVEPTVELLERAGAKVAKVATHPLLAVAGTEA